MALMLRRLIYSFLLPLLIVCSSLILGHSPVAAATIDAYVLRYLDAKEPVELPLDEAGTTRLFSPAQLSEGKRLFGESCTNCHVGGATLPDPATPLSLTALQGAMPPRDTINSLVAFLRQPMTYDGSEETFWCRQIPESWLSQAQVEALSAFILRAAQKAPGWGTSSF
ncbi:MAG TPA: photosystem II cytochrome PsbV2 [Coleofasciculaceae cyanobacterium]